VHELVPATRSGFDTDGALAPAVRTARLGFGLAGLIARGAFVAAGGRPGPDNPRPRGPALWAGAALGLAMEAERRAVDAAEALVSAGSSVARGAAGLPVVDGQVRRLDAWLLRWNAHARMQQRRNRAEAEAVVRRVVRQVTDAVLEHVDFGRVVDRIPINEIVEKVDVDSIIKRIDVAALVNGAVREMDLGGLIRESTEGVTAEAVDAVRSQTVKTDLFVSRLFDRVLFRKAPRDLTLSAPVMPEAPEGGT